MFHKNIKMEKKPKRKGTLRTQYCPYDPDCDRHCGDWCPKLKDDCCAEDNPLKAGYQLLRTTLLSGPGGICPELLFDSDNWRERVWATVIDAWLRLLSKKDSKDMTLVLQRIDDLRRQQKQYEKTYLDSMGDYVKCAALELIGLYHLARAAEIAILGNGPDRKPIEYHFDWALTVCNHARLIELELIVGILREYVTKD